MNKRQKKKYIKKIVNASGMSIKLHYKIHNEIKNYYKLQKLMNKNFRGCALWQSI